jgi:hypothetical protein
MLLTLPQLSGAEKKAFDLYKSNAPFEQSLVFADTLNEALAKGTPLSPAWEAHKLALDGLFSRSSLSKPMTLYRAMLDPYLTPHIQNNILTYPAYMSTGLDEYSIQRHFSTPFRGVAAALLQIQCPTGTPALDGEMNPDFGNHEQEILLMRGSKFEVTKLEVISDRRDMGLRMSDFYAQSFSELKVYHLRYTP